MYIKTKSVEIHEGEVGICILLILVNEKFLKTSLPLIHKRHVIWKVL